MLFCLYARFKPDVEQRRDALHELFNEHLMQRFIQIHLGAPLFDDQGRRSGILMVIEADDIEKVRHFLRISPYAEADLYENVDIQRMDLQVGRVG